MQCAAIARTPVALTSLLCCPHFHPTLTTYAAAYSHLRSLRTMKRDGGWIHSLMEEAENE